jgi:hypothetical protein
MRTTPSQKTSWVFHSIALVSAALCGINCFIIAWNFMIAQTSMTAALVASSASLVLNFALYLRGGAEKMAIFWEDAQNNPLQVVLQNWIELCAGICIGFLTFQAYQTQLALLPAHLAVLTPVLAITWAMSTANALANFVLFSNASTPAITPSSPEKTKKTWRDSLSQFWTQLLPSIRGFLQQPAQTQLKKITSLSFALVQSMAYTYLNFACIVLLLQQSVARTYAIAISGFLSGALFLGEVTFNSKQTQDFLNTNKRPPLWYYGLIAANGVANGWIALYDLTFLPKLAQYGIVSIGTAVSFAVMHNNYNSESKAAEFFPDNSQDQHRVAHAIHIVIQILSIAYLATTAVPITAAAKTIILAINVLATGMSLEKIHPSDRVIVQAKDCLPPILATELTQQDYPKNTKKVPPHSTHPEQQPRSSAVPPHN